jgi:hypothetical protein
MGLLHLLITRKFLPGSACVNAHYFQLGQKLALLFNAPALFSDEPPRRGEDRPCLGVHDVQPSSAEHNLPWQLTLRKKFAVFWAARSANEALLRYLPGSLNSSMDGCDAANRL